MTGSNRRPSACKADALPAELILRYTLGDVLLSQGENPQLPSALRSLTSVFGMGTGVTFSLSSPNFFKDIYYYTVFLKFFKGFLRKIIPSKLDNIEEELEHCNHFG